MTNWYKDIRKKYQRQKITPSDFNKLLVIIPIVCIVTVSFYLISELYLKSKQKQINKNKCSTTCKITDVRINRGTYILFDYQINGKYYSDRKPAPYGAFVDANYILNYQCDDPTNIDIIENSVFFNNNNLSDTLITIPKEITISKYFYSFSFVDKNGIKITRTQEINNKLTNKIKDKSILVTYLQADHNKAILF